MQAPSGRASGRLLVVDDDVELCELMTQYLRREGFDVEAVHDAQRGVERALSNDHALVILDVMLPSFNGFEALRRIRAESAVPVLMLTARGDEVDRVVGLEIGADDYLPKPCSHRELVARIHAILRRSALTADALSGPLKDSRLKVGDVEMDLGARIVRRASERVELTAVEFKLLEVLLHNAGSVVMREDLCKEVLDRRLTPFDRSLDVHVSNLRKKLGHTIGQAERIATVRGVGYAYAAVSPMTDGRRATDDR
ncbi:MAG: response regulator transcription factor [Phycisphaerae bacterium]|nr:response regulator transcription factor [Phycisphaerae bacterium]